MQIASRRLHASSCSARSLSSCCKLHTALPRLPARRRQLDSSVHALPVSEIHAELHTHLSAAFDLADAAAAAASSTASSSSSSSGGFLAPLTDTLETVLKTIQTELDKLKVPYSYGYSIIILTAMVKLVTLPLTKKQVESTMAVQSLKPRIEMMKARYGDDQAKIKRETNFLYEQAGVNPLAGCLPSIATIPIFIGLYRSLTNVATEGLLDTQGFYWIPSLAGPTSITTRGTEWLLPIVDGQPPIGWENAAPYLVLPVLLVLCQYVSSSVISPPIDPTAENANTQRALYTFLPMMIGWFALNVPSGLGLYYLANTVFTTLVQVWLRKLGGADVQINELGPITKVGTGRRMGQVASDDDVWTPSAAFQASIAADAAAAAAAAEAGATNAAAGALPGLEQQQQAAASSGSSSQGSLPPGARWARRKRAAARPAAAAGSA
ncbi:60Kd inner membrane protein-domain-containing protein [Scenedesmus sp. NREL 46B-D3]|nr:60Kd inner membrane protein-domain-containing protein [Scenedesmus sp. NREL 46B-D3]